MIFKTEEERDKALAEIPDIDDAPTGVNLDQWKNEQMSKMYEIENAKIGKGEDTSSNQDQPTLAPTGTDDTPKNDYEKEIERLNRRAANLEDQRDSISNKYESQIQELRTEIAGIKEKPAENHKDIKTDEDIQEVQNAISQLEKEMNRMDEDDDDYIKKVMKMNKLSMSLNSLITKRNADITQKHEDELKKLKDKQEKEKVLNKREETFAKNGKAIEKFRETVPELQGDVPYEEMGNEYGKFARELAALYYDKPLDDIEDTDAEKVIVKYLKKTPELMEVVQEQGLKEPTDMRKFILLSEINALRTGYVQNRRGEWIKYTDDDGEQVRFKNLKSAYNHMMEENGSKKKELLNAEKKAATGMMNAINKRASITELDGDHRNVDINEMSEETAHDMVEKYDEDTIVLRARKNFNDPLVQEYNKALIRLGYPAIKQSDFE